MSPFRNKLLYENFCKKFRKIYGKFAQTFKKVFKIVLEIKLNKIKKFKTILNFSKQLHFYLFKMFYIFT